MNLLNLSPLVEAILENFNYGLRYIIKIRYYHFEYKIRIKITKTSD